MPAKDQFHEAVKNALVKEGSTITDDPLFLKFGEVDMYVDLGAEKVISAWKDGEKIAVEVKSFIQPTRFLAWDKYLSPHNKTIGLQLRRTIQTRK